MTSLRAGLLACALALPFAAPSAGAAVIEGASFTVGASTQVIGGLTWTVTPGRSFQQKSIGTPRYTGVGVSGGLTNDEIDVGEELRATGPAPFRVTSLTLGMLYDGPEFGDVVEIAQVTVFPASGAALIYTLTSDAVLARWSGSGTVTQLSPPTAQGGAVWRVDRPFGGREITAISFTALASGLCFRGACDNQSDYTLVQLATAVPEPASLALLGAGLLGLGAARRRRG